MSRRIDIELTSARDDQTWTWRAAGAKQPKGVVASSLLPSGAAVGDVLRADVETTLDGTDVLSVSQPKAKKDSSGERIELIGATLADDQLVITTLAPKRGRDRGDRGPRGDRGDRGDRRGRGDGPRSDGDRRPRRDGDRPARPDGERGRGGPREGGDRARRERPAPPSRPKAKRLRAGRTHRKAALDLLAPEEQVIAEHLLRGGVPAVRQAVEKQNEQAQAEGRPQVKADALLAVAEKLLPALRAAEWRDRAEAAVADLDELDLRDLRSVVVAAESAAKDEESKALAEQLRTGLTQRVDAEQTSWLAEISETLTEGRVVRALRLSSRPPKAGSPLPADIATKLAEQASAALTAETLPDRWATVLDALSFSPVRLTVIPESKPDSPSDELIAVIAKVASRLPRIAEAFGITPPPESARSRPPRPGGRKGPKGGERAKGGAPKPPRPPKPPKPPVQGAPDSEAAVDGAPPVQESTGSETPSGDPAAAQATEPPTEPVEAVPSAATADEATAAVEGAAPAESVEGVEAVPTKQPATTGSDAATSGDATEESGDAGDQAAGATDAEQG